MRVKANARAALFILGSLIILLCEAGRTHAAEVAINVPAPEFTFTDIERTMAKLSDFRGKFVVLVWFNHGCPFTRKHYRSDKMQDLHRKYTGEGVVWISINSTSDGHSDYRDAAMSEKEADVNGTSSTYIVLDPSGEIGKLYGAKTTPDIFIVNLEGKLIYKGAVDSIASTDVADIQKATNYIDAALTEALAGKPVSTPETKPYGCSVKYKE